MITECNHDPMFKICDICSLLNQRETLTKIVDAALAWRKDWPDTKDEIEAEGGCDCKLCQLIRACDEYTLRDSKK